VSMPAAAGEVCVAGTGMPVLLIILVLAESELQDG